MLNGRFLAKADPHVDRIVGLTIIQTNPRIYRLEFNRGPSVSVGINKILSPKLTKKEIVKTRLNLPAGLPNDNQRWEEFILALMKTAAVESPSKNN